MTVTVWVMSPLSMKLTGDATWYALPLLAALVVVAWRGRLTREELGLTGGRGFYGHATLLPLVVVGCVVWLATLFGVARVGETPLGLLGLQVSTMAVLTTFGAILTEDGFFRGALWGALQRAGRSADEILIWTSTAFVIWYVPILWMTPSPVLGAEAFLVHVVNTWLLAFCWGLLRLVSGSIVVVAWSHGLWNGLAYTLFGFGAARGAMGVVDPLRFDPERGWAGIAINATAVFVLWRWWRRKEAYEAAVAAEDAADAAHRAARADASTAPKVRGK
ncbi:MAG: CPBP family intramembrane glutamic endopeptidase [Gemmatimonadota bacterium]